MALRRRVVSTGVISYSGMGFLGERGTLEAKMESVARPFKAWMGSVRYFCYRSGFCFHGAIGKMETKGLYRSEESHTDE